MGGGVPSAEPGGAARLGPLSKLEPLRATSHDYPFFSHGSHPNIGGVHHEKWGFYIEIVGFDPKKLDLTMKIRFSL